MRYLIAMVFAVAGAAAAAIYLGSPVASWAVNQFTFDSPDSVANLHSAVFMAVNIAGLVAGYLIGWVIAGPLTQTER